MNTRMKAATTSTIRNTFDAWGRPVVFGAALLVTVTLAGRSAVGQAPENLEAYSNSRGVLHTFSTAGSIDRQGPFFVPLGKASAVTCEDCHFASDGWGISASHVQQLFATTAGRHPLFAPSAGNNLLKARALGENATPAELRAAYSLLLTKGDVLVRRSFNAADADFTLVGVVDHSLCREIAVTDLKMPGKGTIHAISGAEYLKYTSGANDGKPQFWLYRRPLPTTNLLFQSTAGWDGAGTIESQNPEERPTRDGMAAITRAAIIGRQTGANLTASDGHVYSESELSTLSETITKFMYSTYTAQDEDRLAGSLADNDKDRGIYNLTNQAFHFGDNEFTVEQFAKSEASATSIFTQYDGWKNDRNARRASIARGQTLFNSPRLKIDNVGGLNDAEITMPNGNTVHGPRRSFTASCGGCHNTPGTGNHASRILLNIGLADRSPAFFGTSRVADLPVFILRNKATGEIVQTTDPGRAVVTGKFADIGQFKVPSLRGLAARAPYFHNGVANTLEELVDYYNSHYTGRFTAREKADLVAFLISL